MVGMFPSDHPREAERLAALERLRVLDTAAEERFDRLTEIVAACLDVPIALVSLVDRDRQWFKARKGLSATETPRDVSFCGHAIVAEDDALFLVEDASTDDRFRDNPLVVGDPRIRFYAGQVIHAPNGLPVGTVCAIDRRPRELTEAQRRVLANVAWMAERELARIDESELLARVLEAEATKSLILDTLSEGVVLQDAAGRIIEWNAAAERVLGMSADQLAGRVSADPRWRAVHADGTPWPGETHPAMQVLKTGRPVYGAVMGVVRGPDPDDPVLDAMAWLSVNSEPVLDGDGVATHALTAFADVTAQMEELARRQEIEARLERSEESARISLDALEQGVILAAESGVIHRMNPAAQRILGYAASELTALWQGPDWTTFDEFGAVLPPEERPIGKALSTGKVVSNHVVGWLGGDGRRVLLRLSCTPNVDDSGRFLVAFTDITEAHLAQRILDATFDTAPVGLALVDTERGILRCNAAFEHQAGRSTAELVGSSLGSIFEPDHEREAATSEAGLLPFLGDDEPSERRVRRPGGDEAWVKAYVAEIGAIDRPLAIAASIDVTKERRLLKELARFGHLFRRANDFITVIDRSGVVLYSSPSSRAVLLRGGTVERFVDVVHDDDIALVEQHLGTLGQGATESGPFTFRTVDQDGVHRYVECVAVNLLDEPDVCGIVMTARDITDRELLARQLAHQVRHDVLTGLGNRKLLDDTIAKMLEQARYPERALGVCFLDLDRFKAINDRLGHGVGDALLQQVAIVIAGATRNGDASARIGGDEFVVLLANIGEVGAMTAVARRLRDEITAIECGGMNVGVSIGLALSTPTDTPATLLHRADTSLYRAKDHSDSWIDTSEICQPLPDASAAPMRGEVVEPTARPERATSGGHRPR